MKKDVKIILKERDLEYLFTDTNYNIAKSLLKYAGTAKHLFRIDPYYKAKWIADMIEKNCK